MGLAAAKVTYAQHRRVNVRFLGCKSPLICPSRARSFLRSNACFAGLNFFLIVDLAPPITSRLQACAASPVARFFCHRGRSCGGSSRITRMLHGIDEGDLAETYGTGRVGYNSATTNGCSSLHAERAATLRNAAGAACLRAGSSGAKAALPQKMKVPNSSPVESEHALFLFAESQLRGKPGSTRRSGLGHASPE